VRHVEFTCIGIFDAIWFGMNALPKILLALTGVAALSIAYPASVQAVPTTYQYTGKPFTEVAGVYTTDDFVTAMVTLADPLGANFHGTVTPTAFTLSDGVQTLTNTTPSITSSFNFVTNARGEITLWHVSVDLVSGNSVAFIQTVRELGPFNLTQDIGTTDNVL